MKSTLARKILFLFSAAALATSLVACESESTEEVAEAEPGAAAPAPAPVAEEGDSDRISPGFSPNPMVLRGEAGGARDGSVWTGTAPHDDCIGYFPDSPQHELELAEFENLSFLAEASVDLALVIEGPSGTRCNDDFEGENPGIVGSWPAGTYKVYVGAYGEGVKAQYTLMLEAREAVETQTHSLQADFSSPFTAESVAGGSKRGDSWDGTGDCTGYMPEEPQHILELGEFDALSIVAESNEDLTIVIEGADDTWCNDDFSGLDPGVVGALSAGTYKVFVGSLDTGMGANYTLSISELTVGETTRESLEPGFLPDPYTVSGLAGGTRDGSEWTGTSSHNDCTGKFPEEPQHILELEDFDRVKLLAESSTDLTMIVEGPEGTWCNDDLEGLNPGFVVSITEGTYKVFVGTLDGGQAPHSFQVSEY